ncbi:50S ribosomal protein L22 [Metamycoplasma cloacale]|uniref:Large ribosomal subunit protein uL22 n=1 Tax=Metamycoplasma cloacale TaxID=92401 RepID=A0A2Z4LLQ7_9BACT|nr:50S ribosomal protein L22 [Metamycoplasma cloacale]VEU79486.1 50S ribosomal protein L22 [Metamycoplasma cloacale]
MKSTHEVLNKTVKASVKMQRISARKARLVADLIRYKSTTQALIILHNTNKKAAPILLKLLNSAIANATNNNGLNATKLYITKLLVNEGPTLKRYQPHSQGRAYQILKRTSHFYIEVSELASGDELINMIEEEAKEEKTVETKPEKKTTKSTSSKESSKSTAKTTAKKSTSTTKKTTTKSKGDK